MLNVNDKDYIKRSLGYPDDGTVPSTMHDYIRLMLASHRIPIKASVPGGIIDLTKDLLADYQERMRLLQDFHCPIARRLQDFLNNHFADVADRAQGKVELPHETLDLHMHGIARALSLPADPKNCASKNAYVSSYRLMQGVLHNPKNDKRTTIGSFHIVEGGLPISDDKYRVPRVVGANLFYQALQFPKEDLKLPYLQNTDIDVPCPPLALYLRPIVRPAVPGVSPAQSMETLVIAPGALASNLDFMESVFGNAGDAFLPENDAALHPETWTGHSGLIILAPHLTRLSKKSLGLPNVKDATELQKAQGMCWETEDEPYNGGRAFKVTVRTDEGIICTIIADNYFGYCKKEVKTQISYASNLGGLSEEEHSGGTIAYPSYSFGREFDGLFEARRWKYLKDYHFEDTLKILGAAVTFDEAQGYAVDKRFGDIYYIPEDAHFSLTTSTVTFTYKGAKKEYKINPKVTYILPSGYQIRMQHHPTQPAWRLIGVEGKGINLHKPCTVSGGGKSELAKSITGTMMYGSLYVSNPAVDFKLIDEILNYPDYSKRFRPEVTDRQDSRELLSPERSLGSTIEMLTPSELFTDEYNNWIKSFPPHILPIVYYVKRFYNPSWGKDWQSHFSMDLINSHSGHELKFENRMISAAFLRVGFTKDGVWRTYKTRNDFMPTEKIQTEDDISASITVPAKNFKYFNVPVAGCPSAKLAVNCEFRLFQRPDDCIYRGQDAQCEWDLSQYGNFLANYEPLKNRDAENLVSDVSEFEKYTKPMKKTIRNACALKDEEYFVASSDTRIVGPNGKRSANPRYLQVRPDVVNERLAYIADIANHLYHQTDVAAPLVLPVDVMLIGRRISKPAKGLPNLAVYNPIHYQEMPEFLMDIICGMSGTSPSTTGAGSEGALTKGPFNALPFTADIDNLFLSCTLCGIGGWSTPTGYIGPNIQFAHDSSVITPEIFCRMRPEERDPAYLIKHGFLEKVADFEYKGKTVQASRLGYRITDRFSHFLGRVFDYPQIFDEAILKPETQDMDSFVEGIDEIVTAQRVIAEKYFRDGTVEYACPPVKALLHIMAKGSYEGKTLNDPEIRAMFTRENVLKSDWYRARLANQQQKDVAHTKRSIAYIREYMSDVKNAPIVESMHLKDTLDKLVNDLAFFESPAYLDSLYGTIGCDLLNKAKA